LGGITLAVRATAKVAGKRRGGSLERLLKRWQCDTISVEVRRKVWERILGRYKMFQ
jgi:hypothetical protein